MQGEARVTGGAGQAAGGLEYNVANVIGSLLLAIDAWRAQQWGFVLPEGAWCLFTMPSLLRAWRARGSVDPS